MDVVVGVGIAVALTLVLGCLGALLVALLSLRREIARLEGQIAAAPQAQLGADLGALQKEQSRLAEAFGSTSQGVASLAGVTTALQADLRAMAAHAQARASAETEAREVLRRLEGVLAGAQQRGAAGENMLAEVLASLPPGMKEQDVRFGNQPVEFAVRLPGGKVLPIDSKWPAMDKLERLSAEQDPKARVLLVRSLEMDVLAKAEEVAKYLDPERTLMLGVAALPDAVYHACTRPHAEAFKKGVVLVPYSLAVPYVLSVLVLMWKFGSVLDTGRLHASISTLEGSLDELSEILDGHMSRALTMLQNATDRQRRVLSDCVRALDALRVRPGGAAAA